MKQSFLVALLLVLGSTKVLSEILEDSLISTLRAEGRDTEKQNPPEDDDDDDDGDGDNN